MRSDVAQNFMHGGSDYGRGIKGRGGVTLSIPFTGVITCQTKQTLGKGNASVQKGAGDFSAFRSCSIRKIH